MTTSVALHPDNIHVLARDEGAHLHVIGQLATIKARRATPAPSPRSRWWPIVGSVHRCYLSEIDVTVPPLER